MLNKFLTAFVTRTANSPRRGRPARHNAPDRRLRMECLENRLTFSASPVVVTVTSSADSGPGSLRAAITSAVPGETIEFAKNVHTITLTSGELPISTSLTIEGPGANRLSISGNNASRVFDVASGASLTVGNVTIADGTYNTTLGGSILTYGGGGILNQVGPR